MRFDPPVFVSGAATIEVRPRKRRRTTTTGISVPVKRSTRNRTRKGPASRRTMQDSDDEVQEGCRWPEKVPLKKDNVPKDVSVVSGFWTMIHI